MLKIGILKENKQPADKRTALSPKNCKYLLDTFPNQISIDIESSSERIFKDEQYQALGCNVVADISSCDFLFGIKEVPVAHLIPDKTYFFFSHTIKKQAYNRKMMQKIIAEDITLIDYEVLARNGKRILGFGFHAGIVGAYNGLLTYGKKHRLFFLKPANQLLGYADLIEEIKKINLPAIRIVLTGGGRVASGAIKLLTDAGIKQVNKETYLSLEAIDEPVFTNLTSADIFERKDKMPFDRAHFHAHHADYEINFTPFFQQSNLMINGIYWSSDMPIFFTKDQVALDDFKISVIADISCDVNGSIPITYQAASIAEPVIGWSKKNKVPCIPFLEGSIDIMAVSNLPSELPEDASELFGKVLANIVIPELLKLRSEILQSGTICHAGQLTEKFSYLADYAYQTIKE